MDDFDIDKLIGNGLRGGTASEGFRERVLRESTGALVRGRALRSRLRVAGLTLGIVLIAVGAFVCGQLSVPGQVIPEQENWTNVPTELVAWLDAGRFFEQLGMNARAERAYREAGELIPQEAAEIIQARLYGDRIYAGLLADPQGVGRCRAANVEARCGIAEVGALDKAQGLNGILSRIMAKYLGG
jgi:hypothetical protein